MIAKVSKEDSTPAIKGFIKFLAVDDNGVEQPVTFPIKIMGPVEGCTNDMGESLTKIQDSYGRRVYFTHESKDSIDEKIANAVY